ncbi:MAG: STAS domain-containing protein [Acidimicrobiia bacterium]|nr:STAS domain-containing protein [Acidimicrobiia bacterium]
MPEAGRNLRIEVADTTSPTTLVLTGEIDITTSGRVREALIAVSSSGENKVVVDMTNVTFMDSTGLAALVGPLKRFRSMNGEIVLRSPSHGVRKVLEITGLTRVFTID